MDKAVVADKEPRAVELQAEKTYYWCACGLSQNQPFCDGSHKVTSIEPKAFKPDTSKKVYMCMCKQSKNSPYCDGSHKQLSSSD